MNFYAWAARWQIPAAAIADLQREIGLETTVNEHEEGYGKSEAWAQSQVVLEGAEKGVRLWRNNVGVLKDDTGRPVRYGLANDSARVNKVVKSSDLIGCRPVLITPAHVGQVLGQFVGRECKPPGWRYTGQGREPAQLNWASLLCTMGADVTFATGRGTL